MYVCMYVRTYARRTKVCLIQPIIRFNLSIKSGGIASVMQSDDILF